jgi:hypothetical protein
MEAVGVALGAVSLAGSISGSFVSIIQCFEYVQLGRTFGRDFSRCQARLGALKLRLTRLGVALGVLPGPQTGQVYEFLISHEEVTQAKRLVDSILQDVKEMEQKSKRYADARPQPTANGEALEVCIVSELDESQQALNQKTDDIVSKRLKGTSWTKKTKWALYEKRHFDTLLADISETLGMLETLFPAAVEAQKALCAVEVKELQDNSQETSALELLCKASEENADILLTQAVRDAIVARGSGHHYEWTEVDGNSFLRQGDYIARDFNGQAPIGKLGHDYGTTIIKDQSKARQGDTYGEGDVF